MAALISSLPGNTTVDRSKTVVAILLITGVLALFSPWTAQAAWRPTFTTFFIAIVLEALPYILLASLLAGLIEKLLPDTILPRLARRMGRFGIPAVALGAGVLPTCECGVVSVARGLMRKGLPTAHTVTYLLAAPILNPTVIFTTWYAFGDWRFPALRVLGALLVSSVAGLIVARLPREQVLTAAFIGDKAEHGDRHDHDHAHHDTHDHPDHDHHDHAHHDHAHHVHDHGHAAAGPHQPRALRFLADLGLHVYADFLEMMTYFLFGVFIAACMRTFIDTRVFDHLGQGAISGPLTMIPAAFVMSLCAEADAFLAVTFTEFALPAKLAFLVFGAMCDIKLLLMYRTMFRGWAIVALVAYLVVAVLAYALVLGIWL